MSLRLKHLTLNAPICLVLLGWSPSAGGQQASPRSSAPTGPTAKSVDPAQTVATSDAEQKTTILESDCWRRAMFERNEWLRVQSVFSPDEVARIKADFADRVDQMSAKELQFVLSDLEAKFRILDSREAREVRAWLGNYLSIISDRRRDELLKMIPDFATMNSVQLQQTIDRLGQRRDVRVRQQDALQQVRKSATNPWSQGNTPASRPAARLGYRSPYRPQSFERPFDNVQTGQNRSRKIDPNGGIWMSF
jgi:hypothetical protein